MSSPSFRPLMLATLVDEPVEGDDWIFERKLDDALIHQRCDRYVVDGEVVAFDGARTSFARLQGRSGLSDPEQIVATGIAVKLYLFDMVHLDGEDRDELALRDRKALLRDAFDFDDPLRFCSHRNADGPAFLEQACRDGWEGLIAKRARSRYQSGRSRDWLKLKCTARQEFVIGGFTDPTGSRSRFGALLLGYRCDDALVYAGRVGTGFDQQTLEELGDELERRERPDSPFDDAPDDDVHWVRPDLVCEIGFTEWTNDGKLRHPRYLGLREDKSAEDVVREEPEASP